MVDSDALKVVLSHKAQVERVLSEVESGAAWSLAVATPAVLCCPLLVCVSAYVSGIHTKEMDDRRFILSLFMLQRSYSIEDRASEKRRSAAWNDKRENTPWPCKTAGKENEEYDEGIREYLTPCEEEFYQTAVWNLRNDHRNFDPQYELHHLVQCHPGADLLGGDDLEKFALVENLTSPDRGPVVDFLYALLSILRSARHRLELEVPDTRGIVRALQVYRARVEWTHLLCAAPLMCFAPCGGIGVHYAIAHTEMATLYDVYSKCEALALLGMFTDEDVSHWWKLRQSRPLRGFKHLANMNVHEGLREASRVETFLQSMEGVINNQLSSRGIGIFARVSDMGDAVLHKLRSTFPSMQLNSSVPIVPTESVEAELDDLRRSLNRKEIDHIEFEESRQRLLESVRCGVELVESVARTEYDDDLW